MEKLNLIDVTRQMLDDLKLHCSISAVLYRSDYENYLVTITRVIDGYLYTYLNYKFGQITTTFVKA